QHKEVIYQASVTIEGYSLHDVLARPNIVQLVDLKNYSGLFISHLLTGAGDAKPDNFMVRAEKDDSGHIVSLKLMSIDNDISFSKGNLGLRFKSGKAKLYSDVLNTLFFFPQMDRPVSEEVRQELTETGDKAERIITSWLYSLYEQNKRYEELKNNGFTR